jgi:hypothetical protein
MNSDSEIPLCSLRFAQEMKQKSTAKRVGLPVASSFSMYSRRLEIASTQR